MLHVSQQHHVQAGNGQATKQDHGQVHLDPVHNAIVRLTGWDGETGGKGDLVHDMGALRAGQAVKASVRAVTLGRQPNDFSHLRKAGLRTGGFVLMRKAVAEADGTVSARSVESLLDRESDGLASVLHGAAACILPSPAGTAMVDACLIALAHDAVTVTTVESAAAQVASALELACTFGSAGLILTGTDPDGNAVEVAVGGDRRAPRDEITERFMRECPSSAIAEAERSGYAWWLVPFFHGEVDIDRSSKVSAQRANHDYGSPDEPLWSMTNAFMRTFSQDWLVADVSPVVEGPSSATGLLLDLLER